MFTSQPASGYLGSKEIDNQLQADYPPGQRLKGLSDEKLFLFQSSLTFKPTNDCENMDFPRPKGLIFSFRIAVCYAPNILIIFLLASRAHNSLRGHQNNLVFQAREWEV